MLDIAVYNASETSRIPIKKMKKAAENVFLGENIASATLSIVVVSDEKIHELNKKHLEHDYPTDVITFSLDNETIDGEIYISADTARMQAREYGVSFTNELMRLSAHGALHLVGYDDATDELRLTMKTLEDKYIALKA